MDDETLSSSSPLVGGNYPPNQTLPRYTLATQRRLDRQGRRTFCGSVVLFHGFSGRVQPLALSLVVAMG